MNKGIRGTMLWGAGGGSVILLMVFSIYALTNGGAEGPLEFRKREADLGVYRVGIDGDAAQHTFTFTVKGEKPVRITDIRTSCGCLQIDGTAELIGKELAPGYKGKIVLRMSTDNRAGICEEYAELVTAPPSSEPISLLLKAFVVQPPMLASSPVLAEALEGHRPTCRIVVHRLRDADSQKLVLNPADSDIGPFELVTMETSSEKRPNLNFVHPPYIDQIVLELRADRCFPAGHHQRSLSLAWEGNIPVTHVPVTVRVIPSVTVSPARVFMGEMLPGEHATASVRVIANNPTQHVQVEAVECDLPFVRASADSSKTRALLRVVAPDTPGRFEGTALIRVTNSQELLTCTVSGVVGQSAEMKK